MADITANDILRAILAQFPQADPESEDYDTGINGGDAVDFICEIVPKIREALDADQPKSSKDEVTEAVEAVNDLISAAKLVVERWSSGNLAEAVTNLNLVIGWAESALESMPVAPQPDINKELLGALRNMSARFSLMTLQLPEEQQADAEMISRATSKAIARAESVQVEPIISSQTATILKDLVEMISEVEDIEHDQFGCKGECALCAAKNYIARVAGVEKGESCTPENTYTSTWNYHKHGEHAYFSKEDWRYDASNGDTILGYQEWVEHNLESMLNDISLDGVDAIEVAGCTETDGHVDVVREGEEAAEFFSVYTHRPNVGVECHCDFNTKDQAISFAIALAARTGIPVYGNCCSLEVG